MSRQGKFSSVNVLGIDIDAITTPQAIDFIIKRAQEPDGPAGYVVKPYVEFVDRAADDPALQQLLNEAELTLADGIALIWAAAYLHAGPHSWQRFIGTLFQIVLAPRALTRPLPERIGGISFTWPLLQAAAREGVSVFLIGKETVREIDQVSEVVRQRLPDLHIAGTRCGRDFSRPREEVSEAWIQATLESIQRSHADLILVGMGFPLQERVMARLAPHLSHGLLIGEGGSFDYEQFGGSRRKAPEIMQRLGLEWLWRLMLEPRRWRRQLAIPRFIWRVWRAR